MNMKLKRLSVLFGSAVVGLFALSVGQAANLNLTPVPLFLNGAVAPLNMLVMGRDHKLYYEAYNDHSNLDGDAAGTPEVGYLPDRITYFGYFDSFKCYSYDNGSGMFVPAATTANKKCSGNWSGDWLNYVTTSRIDALRKVLYGGYRLRDTDGETVLERSYIPQDAHSWGKSYESTAHDGYDIHEYTPLSQPATNSAHLFANTTLRGDANQYPLLRVITDKQDSSSKPLKIWNWLSIERPVAGGQVVVGTNAGGGEVRQDLNPDPTDYHVRVKVCDKAVGLEKNCRTYGNSGGGSNYKPTGLLQDFGEQDTMKFGLITGSYAKNTDGGVLRRTMGSIRSEIKTDGTFDTSVTGIIQTLDRLRTTGFNGSYAYDCGWKVTGPISAGECQMWGNPIGEMMYEAMRYFAGKGTPTGDYSTSFGAGEESQLPGGGLPVATWDDPYSRTTDPAPYCAKPFETVISDINPSYDSDKLPGSAFNSWSGNDGITGLNVSTIGQQIWNQEIGGSKTFFIGQSLSDSNDDHAPTPKTVTSFGNIRGLAPEEPTKEGSYYSASVAYYGLTHDMNAANKDQFVQTFAVALASPLPRIEIPVNGRKITLVPFAKTVGGGVSGQNVSASSGSFQPTNQIVDFYIDTLTSTYGKFRVNYEDVEQGADHDMDAIVQYEYTVRVDGTVDVTLTSQYAAGSLIQHIGYVISGTTHDGIYFEVRDTDTSTGSDPDYYLDTPPAFTGTPPAPSSGAGRWSDGVALPLANTRTFTPGATAGADLLKDPLWYAAKWGGFLDKDHDGTPNLDAEWDDNGDKTPDNYFLVTNALTLQDQLTKAFTEILHRTSSAASASVNAGSISNSTRVYQAVFDSADWTGQLKAFKVNGDGSLGGVDWEASTKLPTADNRHIITLDDTGAPVPFRWNSIGTSHQAELGNDELVLKYLRGDGSQEGDGTTFRKRDGKLLGDIVNSSPVFVGTPPFSYRDSGYTAFQIANAVPNRTPMVYAGANDGMLHGFDATTGVEKFAFIPGTVFRNLADLPKPTYTHRYYVDGTPSMGDAYYGGAWHTVLLGGLNSGGQAVYALDVTNPNNFNTEGSATNAFRWEFTDANDADLGYTFSRPAIVKVRTSSGLRWAAIFGNGYNNTVDDTATGGRRSTTGNAVLYVVDIETGALIRKIDTLSGAAQDPTGGARPNGLATAAAVDINGDNVIDYVFAGDLFGHMWKFDITNTDPTAWAIPFGGNPLFTAKDGAGKAQPITERPEVGRGPNGLGMVVLFGTGKFLEAGDKVLANLSTQTFYGLYDPNNGSAGVIAGRNQLTQQQIVFEGVVKSIPSRAVTQNSTTGTRGWYLDLLSPGTPPVFKGEMSVSDPILRNKAVIFATLIPSNQPCDAGGRSWLMVLDALSGGSLDYPPFNDTVVVNGNTYVISGEGDDDASFGKPGILAGSDTDHAYEAETNGDMPVFKLNPGPNDRGRQSWRQLR